MKKRTYIYFFIAIILVGLLLAAFNNQKASPLREDTFLAPVIPELRMGTTTIELLIADTPEKQIQGLSGLAVLHPTQGMLFVFGASDYHQIWMKDMLFPLDILWMDQDFKIVDIKHAATPESYPEIFTPHEKSDYVLELNAGFTEKNNIKIGDVFVPNIFSK